MNHQYLNSVIEELILELNNTEVLNKKYSMPGNLYHSPVVIRGIAGNIFEDIGDYEDEKKYIVKSIKGVIKDAQAQAKKRVAKVLVGYVAMSRANQSKNLKEVLSPIIENAVLDLKEKLGTTYNNVPYIGEHFMTFLKNEDGNYFSDMENAAAYELKIFSNCAINPPTLMQNTFDKTIAKDLWNIRL